MSEHLNIIYLGRLGIAKNVEKKAKPPNGGLVSNCHSNQIERIVPTCKRCVKERRSRADPLICRVLLDHPWRHSLHRLISVR